MRTGKSYKLHFLLLLLLQINFALTRKIRDDCNEMASSLTCQCKQAGIEFEVSCADANAWTPSIRVSIRPEIHVLIECDKINPSEYALLPNMTIGNNPMVVIKKCPLPGYTPISKIFQKLGITKVNSLLFESDNLDVNLTREHLSGLQNLGRLRVNSKSLTHLPEDLFFDMVNLTWLELRSGEIELTPNIFNVLEKLEYVELSFKNLNYLPPGIFKNQRHLTRLNLWSNQLRNLTKDVFLGISGLQDLDLSSNGIEQLQPDVFALLTNLSNINLNGNYFKELPEGLFAHNRNLTLFRLMHNRVPLRKLPPGLLANMLQLSQVRLTCDLEMLPADIFANSTTITNMSIVGNHLATLQDGLFADQVNLLDLDLRNNRIQKLPDDLLANTRKLVILRLTQNHLSEINGEIFRNLEKLEYLYLDNNNLKYVEDNAFGGTPHLHFINMENNQLSFNNQLSMYGFSSATANTPFNLNSKNLKTLILRNNTIQCIFVNWRIHLRNLHYLDLSYNNITELGSDDIQFLNKEHLQINLTHNQIEAIDFSGISAHPNNSKPISWDLAHNPINCDCSLMYFVSFLGKHKQFDKNLYTQVLLETDNLICNNPDNLRGLPVSAVNPMDLLCNYNAMDCPRDCKCQERAFDSVLIVNCSNAHLKRVPNLPYIYNASQELHIENNQITQLPKRSQKGYANVSKIYAANNNLTNLHPSQLPDGLTYLDITHNKLKYLNSTTLDYFNSSQKLEVLKLAYNPWTCTCDTKQTLQFSLKNKKIVDFKQMQCQLANGEWEFFEAVQSSEICPLERGLIIAIAVMISVLGCLLGLSGALYYKYEHQILSYIFVHFPWMGGCFSREKFDKNKLFDCFISYSHKDEKFVADVMVKELEKLGFTLCVHGRDWLPGECIPDNIDRSVDESRRTLVVLSQNFVESSWSRMEFRNAHKKALEEKSPKVIVIIYGDLDMENLDHELKAYLSSYTYLKWGEAFFWERLIYSLPHHKYGQENGLARSTLKGSTDDKLELIKPAPVTPPLTTPPGETTKNPIVAQFNGGTPQTAVMIPNGKMSNGLSHYYSNGKTTNGHINGAFIINTNAKQSDV